MTCTIGSGIGFADGRAAMPSAAIVDSQPLRAAETVAITGRGWDAGKKVNGARRHVAVDTLGLLLVVLVTAASVQGRDGGRPLLMRLRQIHHRIQHLWADGGYAGRLVTWAKARLALTVEIVERSDDMTGFVVLPRRWVGRADAVVDLPQTPPCPRLRAAARPPRGHDEVVDDHPHDPRIRPIISRLPRNVTGSQSGTEIGRSMSGRWVRTYSSMATCRRRVSRTHAGAGGAHVRGQVRRRVRVSAVTGCRSRP
ncbi:transposase [Kitasatospora sp. NPDC058218]|uniref:transposase n=1 Tax=Kitasatospora sp. NPDC058218 TaxID=3346385 RepID=UPI0036D8E4DB